jgi:hypothetical protein
MGEEIKGVSKMCSPRTEIDGSGRIFFWPMAERQGRPVGLRVTAALWRTSDNGMRHDVFVDA